MGELLDVEQGAQQRGAHEEHSEEHSTTGRKNRVLSSAVLMKNTAHRAKNRELSSAVLAKNTARRAEEGKRLISSPETREGSSE